MPKVAYVTDGSQVCPSPPESLESPSTPASIVATSATSGCITPIASRSPLSLGARLDADEEHPPIRNKTAEQVDNTWHQNRTTALQLARGVPQARALAPAPGSPTLS
jgi:hypothetical protein